MHAGQSTDAENSRSLFTASNAGDALKVVSTTSAQAIANDTANQNTVAGSGGEAVTGNLQAGK